MDTQRRALMLGAAATMALAAPARTWAQTLSLDEFIQLSARLCQQTPTALDRDMAQRILQQLDSQGKTTGLRALLQDETTPSPLAAELRSIWFTGLMDTPSGAIVVGYQDALTWRSASFLHVPGICGGATGYWSEPPLA